MKMIICLIGFALCISAGRLAGADWPQFRGPSGQGISSEGRAPLSWSESEQIDWKISIDGLGWSSPVIVDGRIYLTTAVPREGGHPLDRSLRTLCLNAANGVVIWDIEVFDQDGSTLQKINRKNSHASPTPICDGEHVYVHFGTSGTACLTIDGEIVWRNRQLKYHPQHGSGSSPVLVDHLLVISCDGLDVQFVVALDRRDGSIAWKKNRPAVPNPKRFAFSTPLVIDVDGRKQVVSPATGCVIAYEPETGDEIWSVRYESFSVIPRPVYGHGLVYVATGYNGPTLLAIRPDGKGDVTDTHIAWMSKKSIPRNASMLLVDTELYFVSDDGIGTCLDAVTGQQHWQKRLGGKYSASPVFAGGHIYFQSEEGKTTIIAAGTRFQEVESIQMEERTLASLAIADSSIFLRSESHLYRISGHECGSCE